MIKGRSVILKIDGSAMAAATNAGVELTQEALEVAPIPGSAEDDGWVHIKPGRHGWGIGHDGLFTEDAYTLLNKIKGANAEVNAVVQVTGEMTLSGKAHLSNVSVTGKVGSFSRLSAKFVCDNFPTLT